MTQREYLALMRQPEHAGINARQGLKDMVKPRGRAIDHKISLNAISSACRALCEALAKLH